MREVFIGSLRANADQAQFNSWVNEALQELARATVEDVDIVSVAQGYTVSNFTDTRTLDAATATAADVAKVLCTFINDIKKKGAKG